MACIQKRPVTRECASRAFFIKGSRLSDGPQKRGKLDAMQYSGSLSVTIACSSTRCCGSREQARPGAICMMCSAIGTACFAAGATKVSGGVSPRRCQMTATSNTWSSISTITRAHQHALGAKRGLKIRPLAFHERRISSPPTIIISQQRTEATAPAAAFTTMSASCFVRHSGGAKPRISPCGMARPITPRSSRAAAI